MAHRNVLTSKGERSSLKVTGQCVAITPEVQVDVPKKPYFVKMAFEEGWAESDGIFPLLEKAHKLKPSDLDLAKKAVGGEITSSLPVVFISRTIDGETSLNPDLLAYRLCGVAHVLVEPVARFARPSIVGSEDRIPYNGSITVSENNSGVIRRFYLGGYIKSPGSLAHHVEKAVVSAASSKSVLGGLGWQDVQEIHARGLRRRLRDSGQIEEFEDKFDEELERRDKIINELEADLWRARRRIEGIDVPQSEILPGELTQKLGRELYDGEFSDRLIYLVLMSSAVGGLDVRTKNFAKAFLSEVQFSGRAISVAVELKQLGTTGKRFGVRMAQILKRIGYSTSEEGKHIKASPPSDKISGPIFNLPKTASDTIRGGKNQSSDIIRDLGLRKLRDED